MENKNLSELAMDLEEQETQAEAAAVSVQDLDQRLERIRAAKLDYDEAKKVADKLYAQFEKEKTELFNILQSVNRDKYSVDGIGTIYTVERGGYKMDEANKGKLFEYINSKYGNDTLRGYLTIKDSKLNEFVKAEVEENGLPPGVLPFESSKQISFRKG